MIRRVISLDIVAHCCKDNKIKYTSQPQHFEYDETEEEFEESLVVWGDRIQDFIAEDQRETVDEELCKKISESLYYCFPDFSNIDVREEITEIILPAVRATIDVILREMRENIDNIDYVFDLKSQLDRILANNDLTREDIKDMIEEQNLEKVLLGE